MRFVLTEADTPLLDDPARNNANTQSDRLAKQYPSLSKLLDLYKSKFASDVHNPLVQFLQHSGYTPSTDTNFANIREMFLYLLEDDTIGSQILNKLLGHIGTDSNTDDYLGWVSLTPIKELLNVKNTSELHQMLYFILQLSNPSKCKHFRLPPSATNTGNYNYTKTGVVYYPLNYAQYKNYASVNLTWAILTKNREGKEWLPLGRRNYDASKSAHEADTMYNVVDILNKVYLNGGKADTQSSSRDDDYSDADRKITSNGSKITQLLATRLQGADYNRKIPLDEASKFMREIKKFLGMEKINYYNLCNIIGAAAKNEGHPVDFQDLYGKYPQN